MEKSIQLHVCGPRGSFPTYGKDYESFGHDTSCYVIKDGKYGIILDCGSGLANGREVLSQCTNIDVLLSHVHYDHILGLFQNKDFFADKHVRFFGDFNNWQKIEQQPQNSGLFKISDLVVGEMISVRKDEIISLKNGFSTRFVISNHPDLTSMIDVWFENKHLCYTGDYEHDDKSNIEAWAQGCDLLLFDGSYCSEDYKRFKGWGHSMWEDGCKIAKENDVKKLLITHHAPQSIDTVLFNHERQAKEIFKQTEFAKENEVYTI